MPIYHYKHDCGFEQRFFLEQDVNSKVIDCYRCGRKVTVHQVRNPNEKIKESDGVKGVVEYGNKNHGQVGISGSTSS